MTTVEELKALGLDTAAKKVTTKVKHHKDLKDLRRKIVIASEKYRVITQDKIDRFNAVLYKRTAKPNSWGAMTFERLQFIPLSKYTEVPPQAILEKLKEAKALKVFDTFEVCKIETVVERPDPLLLGRITGCKRRYFIGQWDNDINIDDILKKNEG